jgi:hypothetical protein
VNAKQAPKNNCKSRPDCYTGTPLGMERAERTISIQPAGVMAVACTHRRPDATRETPAVIAVGINRQTRERQATALVATEAVVPSRLPFPSIPPSSHRIIAILRSHERVEVVERRAAGSRRQLALLVCLVLHSLLSQDKMGHHTRFVRAIPCAIRQQQHQTTRLRHVYSQTISVVERP